MMNQVIGIQAEADAHRNRLAGAITRLGRGDRTALTFIYESSSAKLFGLCLRILNNRSEAEDVLQEVYLTVWRKAATFDPERASPISWLVAIARNRSIDWLRAGVGARRMDPIESADDLRDPAPVAAELVEAAQQSMRLDNCL